MSQKSVKRLVVRNGRVANQSSILFLGARKMDKWIRNESFGTWGGHGHEPIWLRVTDLRFSEHFFLSPNSMIFKIQLDAFHQAVVYSNDAAIDEDAGRQKRSLNGARKS